jgi:hypothetical protein
MLGTLAVWLALRRDTVRLTMLGAFFLVIMVATLVWNLIP